MSKLLLILFVLAVVLAFFAEGRPNRKRWGRIVQRKRWEDKNVATQWNGIKPKLARRWMIRFCSNNTAEEANDNDVEDQSDVDVLTEDEKAGDELIRETRDLRRRRNRKDRRAKKSRGRKVHRRGRGRAAMKAAKQQWRKARIQKRLRRRHMKMEMLCKFLEKNDCSIPETLKCPGDSVDVSEKNEIEEVDIIEDDDDKMENIDNDEDIDEDNVDGNNINDIVKEEKIDEVSL